MADDVTADGADDHVASVQVVSAARHAEVAALAEQVRRLLACIEETASLAATVSVPDATRGICYLTPGVVRLSAWLKQLPPSANGSTGATADGLPKGGREE